MDSYRASNLRQSSDLRKALKDCMRDTTALLGVGIGVPSIASTKVVAVTSADWAWIDTEHTPLSPTLMADIVQTVNYHSEGRMLPIVRVPNHGHEWIAWALDAGAAGVIIPHTETVEQAHAAVRAARFGPLGDRSFPPFGRGLVLNGITDSAPEGQTWVDVANDHIAVIPQIESALGLENLEDIMQVPGVDAIMIGKGDLRLSMRLPLTDSSGSTISLGSKSWTEPAWLAAQARIRALAHKYGMPLVGVSTDANIPGMLRDGYRLLLGTSDFNALGHGITSAVGASRGVVEDARKGMGVVQAKPRSRL